MMLRPVAGLPLGARCAIALSAGAILFGGVVRELAAADLGPARMRVQYAVTFNGFEVGGVTVETQAAEHGYSLTASARLSVLLGVLNWEGETRSTGAFAKEATRPASYSFDFKSGLAGGSTSIAFSENAVSSITQLPPPIINPEAIPLREDHLKGVVDPLSALLVLTRGSGNHPCHRRIPVFDGRERFDLLFSYKGQVPIGEQAADGQPGMALLCRVRYVPIAGHKLDADTEFMAGNEAIEVALRPIPSANVFVPYHISIPTRLGTAALAAKRVEIATPGKPQFALLP